MSEKKQIQEKQRSTFVNSIIEADKTYKIKDKAILFGWISGLLLFISLLWILTQPLQAHYLMRSVNSVLASGNDSRRLSSYIHQSNDTGLFGYWYSMNNTTDMMFVFAVFKDGILIPLGATVTAGFSVLEVVPLSAHALQSFDSLPNSVLQIYINRIESAASNSGRLGS